MDSSDRFVEDEVVTSLDFILSDIQKDVVRLVVLINTVLVLQGATFLFIAWIADSLLATVAIGLIGAVVFLIGLLIGLANMRQYAETSAHVEQMKEEHPGFNSSDESEPS